MAQAQRYDATPRKVSKSSLLETSFQDDLFRFLPTARALALSATPYPSAYDRLSTRGHVFFSGAQRNGVFSSDDVFSCAATSGDVRVCARASSQAQNHGSNTKARRAKDIN